MALVLIEINESKAVKSKIAAYLFTICVFLAISSRAQISSSVSSGCAPLVGVQFTGVSGSTAINWDFGDGSSSQLLNPVHTFSTAGSYTVKYTATLNGSPLNHTLTIKVYGKPKIDFEANGPHAGCKPLTVTFKDKSIPGSGSTITKWEWAYGDGGVNSVNTANPSYIYTLKGKFNVSLKITDSYGCDTSMVLTNYVTVSEPPVISLNTNPNPAAACDPPLLVTFSSPNGISNSPLGSALTYSWDFGNSTTGTTANPAPVNYTTIGNFPVKLKVTDDNNCSSSLSTVVNINKPIASFKVKDTVCKTVQFQNLSTGAIDHFEYGDNTQGTSLTHTYAQSGTYLVKLVVKAGPCTDDTIIKIFVEDVKAKFSSTPHYSCSVPFQVTYKDLSVNAAKWDWKFGDGKISTAQNPVHTFNGGSNNPYYIHQQIVYTDVLMIESHHGCRDTFKLVFNDTINLPTAMFMPDKRNGCVPLTVEFSDSSLSKENIVKYEWIWGDGTTYVGNNTDSVKKHMYANAGTYYPRLVITNSRGCKDTSYMIPIKVGKIPHPSFTYSPSSVCIGQPVTFTNTTPAADSIDIWHFSTDNNIMSSCPNDKNPSWSFTENTGPQSVTLMVGANGCFKDTTYSNIITVKGPLGRFSASGTCDSVFKYTFTPVIKDASLVTWNFGDGTVIQPNQNTNQHHYYKNTGEYKVILKTENPATGCPAFLDTVLVYVKDVKAKISPAPVMCAKVPGSFDASSSVDVHATCFNGYWWYVDNNAPFNSESPIGSFSFPSSGIKDVMLIVKDINGCSDTAKIKVRVSDVNAKFIADRTYGCLPLTVNFTDKTLSDTSIVKWNWTFGNNQSSSLQNPGNTYTQGTGPFQVNLTATNAFGCVGSYTLNITPSIPNASFTAITSQKICAPNPVSFTAFNTNSNTTFLWNFGDGQTSTIKNPVHIYTTGGSYTVKLEVKDSIGCKNEVSIPAYIQVQSKPKAGFKSSVDNLKDKCYPLQVTYTDTSIASIFLSRQWDLGNGSTVVSSATVGTIYQLPGTYTTQLIVKTTFGCTDTIKKNLVVSGPIADFVMNKNIICKGQEVQFTIKDTTDVYTYHWDFGDGLDANAASPINHVFNHYPPNGVANVTLVYWSEDSTCAQTKKYPLQLHQVVADFIRNTTDTLLADTSHCLGVIDAFKNTSLGADSFSWNFGDGSTGSQLHESHQYLNAGTYTVSLNIKNNSTQCLDTIRKSIVVFPDWHIKANGGDTCLGKPIQLNASGGVSYTWVPAGGLSNPSIANPVANLSSTTTFTVSAVNHNGCKADTTIKVNIIAPPGPYGLDTTIVIGQTVILSADCGPNCNYLYNYFWQPKDSVLCFNCPSTEVKPMQDQHYTVLVKDKLGCFENTFYYQVKVLPLSSLDVPQAFTPNGDGVNDVIYVGGWGLKELLEFKIYNRWGELVFETNDLNTGWNGTFNGVPQNIETYAYTVKVRTYVDKEPLVKKGFIQLMR